MRQRLTTLASRSFGGDQINRAVRALNGGEGEVGVPSGGFFDGVPLFHSTCKDDGLETAAIGEAVVADGDQSLGERDLLQLLPAGKAIGVELGCFGERYLFELVLNSVQGVEIACAQEIEQAVAASVSTGDIF